MVKRTHKTWNAEEIQVVQNSNWNNMTRRQRSVLARALKRTVSSLSNKYRSLHLSTKKTDKASNPTSINLDERNQKVAKSTYDKFMNSVLKNAKSATIDGNKIHIYFK